MCVVSMVGDHYQDKWNPLNQQTGGQIDWTDVLNPSVKKNEFEALKKEVEEMKKLLERALEYDKKNNEPHCEMEEKVELLKKVAKLVGVDLERVFKK